jgi:hypothetical protein
LCVALRAASFTFHNEADQPVTFQVWTSGKGFFVTSCNANPGKTCSCGVDCVWYDLYAEDMDNKYDGNVKGAYCGGEYCFLGNVTDHDTVFGACSHVKK